MTIQKYGETKKKKELITQDALGEGLRCGIWHIIAGDGKKVSPPGTSKSHDRKMIVCSWNSSLLP